MTVVCGDFVALGVALLLTMNREMEYEGVLLLWFCLLFLLT